MKQRLISAVVGIFVLIFALLFFDTLVVNCFAAVICGVAVLELLNAAGLTRHKLLSAVSVLFSGLIMFINAGNMMAYMSVFSTIYAVFCFAYLLFRHEGINVKEISYCLMITLLVTLSFFTLITIRDRSTAQMGMFYLLIAFGSAWWSDTGAYFAGTFFGKHKLCPSISPKKTVEGLVGGIFAAILGNLLVSVAFVWASNMLVPMGYFVSHLQVNIVAIALFTPLLSLMGVLGDLSASVIKRQNGIKDFGNIMPGHGGIMDRFDSVLFISPVVFLIFRFFPLVTLVGG